MPPTLDPPFDDPFVAAAVDSDSPLVVVTAHRRENWNGGLARIAAAVGRLATAHPEAPLRRAAPPEPTRPAASSASRSQRIPT